MVTYPDCIPCLFKQALSTARLVTSDEAALKAALRDLAEYVATADLSRSPAELSYDALKVAQKALGADDPYKDVKEQYNRQILAIEDHLREVIDTSDDPMYTALLLASAGNIIDLGIVADVNVDEQILRVQQEGFAADDYEAFKARLAEARTIVYVLDNAGEIVFDKLVISLLIADHDVTAVVRKSPILNDVTMHDAIVTGVTDVCEVIDTGCDVFGVPIRLVSDEFRNRFDAADMRIAKGHANFETLDGSGREVFFVLKAKCACVADELGVKLHDSVLKCQKAC